MKALRKEAPGRDTNILTLMTNVNAIVATLVNDFGGDLFAEILFYDASNAYLQEVTIPLAISDVVSLGLNAATAAGITIAASANSYTVLGIFWGSASTIAKTFTYPTLAVNTARQVTSDTMVIASVEIDASLSLTTGAKGSVTLQYADDSAFTTNVQSAGVGVNGNTGTLVIGLNTVGAGGGNVVGIIPATKYYRLHTTNITGTPTYGTPSIQEVTL